MARRKAPDQRQRTNSLDIGTPGGPPVEVPKPPHPARRKLLAETVQAWERFWRSELAGLVQPADEPALARLWHLYDTRARFERILLRSPFVPGSAGQTVVHPAAREIASLDGRILALEDRFGITPMGRLKLGLTFGAAVKTLEDINADFEDHVDEPDPRLASVIDISPVDDDEE